MSTYKIHQALVQSLIDLNLGLPIAHENVDFKTSDTGDFLQCFLLPAGRESLMKDDLGVDEERGIFQISYYRKAGESVGPALSIVDSVLDCYKHNHTISHQGQDVVIINSQRNAGRNEQGWWRIDISINYKSDIQRI